MYMGIIWECSFTDLSTNVLLLLFYFNVLTMAECDIPGYIIPIVHN